MARKREYPEPVTEKEKQAAAFLREKRIEKGYRHGDMAKYLNVNRTNYLRKEKGEVPFTAGEFLYLNEVIDSLPVRIKKQPIKKLIPNI